jgi:hypothetical protein
MSKGREADKFLNFPAPPTFSRNREAAQTAGRLSFAYFWYSRNFALQSE